MENEKITVSENNGGNPYHEPVGKSNGGQFASKPQTFVKESRADIETRQDIKTFHNFQTTLKTINASEWNDDNKYVKQAKRKLLDMFLFSPAFEDIFLPGILESNEQYLGLNDYTVVANDKDDGEDGVDFYLYKKNGGIDRIDLKCSNELVTGKTQKIRIKKTTNDGRFIEDFLIDQNKKTNYYAFCNMNVVDAQSTKWNIWHEIKDILANSDLNEEEKYAELHELSLDNQSFIKSGYCNIMSRDNLQNYIYQNFGMDDKMLDNKSNEMRQILNDCLNDGFDKLAISNKMLNTNYKIRVSKLGNKELYEMIQVGKHIVPLICEFKQGKFSTFFEFDESMFGEIKGNKYINPFNK